MVVGQFAVQVFDRVDGRVGGLDNGLDDCQLVGLDDGQGVLLLVQLHGDHEGLHEAFVRLGDEGLVRGSGS